MFDQIALSNFLNSYLHILKIGGSQKEAPQKTTKRSKDAEAIPGQGGRREREREA
jgi:hypothetical protein